MAHHTHVLICAFKNVDCVLKIKRCHKGTSRFLFYESEDLATQGPGGGWQQPLSSKPLSMCRSPRTAQPGLPLWTAGLEVPGCACFMVAHRPPNDHTRWMAPFPHFTDEETEALGEKVTWPGFEPKQSDLSQTQGHPSTAKLMGNAVFSKAECIQFEEVLPPDIIRPAFCGRWDC